MGKVLDNCFVGSNPTDYTKGIVMKQRMIDFYMNIARQCATMSRAVRLQVGSVIVKNDNIISFSWNGTPSGWDNNCENIELIDTDASGWLSLEEIIEKWPFEGKFWVNGKETDTRYRLVTKPEVLHAESNAISKLARSNSSGEGAEIFITHSPCMECAKLIYQSGIRKVYFGQHYRDTKGIEFLEKSKIEVIQIT